MIESLPITWQELQEKVCRIFQEIGLDAKTEESLETPRGKIDVDVYAIDTNSIDQIKYIVECKNWKRAIPQTVAHSFSTVMHETGGNIGYIISKKGLQKGAAEYIKCTNITGLTFIDFQKKYFDIWFRKYFCPCVIKFAYSFMCYTEEFNSRRMTYVEKLSKSNKKEYFKLYKRYILLGMYITSMCYSESPKVKNIEDFKKHIKSSCPTFILSSNCFRDLLLELEIKIKKITDKFNNVFGKDIFSNEML